MSSALEAFRAQRQAVEELHARVEDVANLVTTLRTQVDELARNQLFRQVLQDEARWLSQATAMVKEVRSLREEEMRRFWPGVWRRWAVALLFALASAATYGAGQAWANRPRDTELVALRARVELLDFVAQRVITMTPSERRQFDALMKWKIGTLP